MTLIKIDILKTCLIRGSIFLQGIFLQCNHLLTAKLNKTMNKATYD